MNSEVPSGLLTLIIGLGPRLGLDKIPTFGVVFKVEEFTYQPYIGIESLPADFASRLTFQSHNFTQPQPIQAADL